MKKIVSSLLTLLSLVMFLFSVSVSAQTVSQTPQSTRDFCTYVISPIPYKSQNQYVSYLQRFLQEQYNYIVSPTGYYGPVTYGYIKKIQRDLGISGPTGSLGPITLTKLRNVWCNGANPAPVNPINTLKPIISLNPVSSNGNSVTLGWNVQNATACTLNGANVNNVSGNQSYTIYSETVYMMKCVGTNGATSETSIVVKPNTNTNSGLQPAVSIYATPNTFTTGQSVMIVWSSTNATSCTLNGQSVAVSGAQQVYMNQNSSYTISCSGNGYTASQNLSSNGVTTGCPTGYYLSNGQCVATQTICTQEVRLCPNGTVMPRDPNCTWRSDMCINTVNTIPTISSFTANTNNISYGQSVTLSWSSNNAISCTLTGNGSTQTLAASGTTNVYPTTATTYSLTCVNSYGASSASSLSILMGNQTSSNGFNLNVAANQTSYYRGSQILIAVTITNNTGTTQTYPIGSSSCPSDVTLRINGIDFYTFTNQQSRVCTADYGYTTVAPGQSYVRAFSGYIPSGATTGTYLVTATLNANNSTSYSGNTSIQVY